MPNYDLSKLGNEEFERLCQSLIKEIIGLGTTTFGDGKDGGREATFTGSAPYPSLTERWCGEWIFQVKYHNLQLIGVAKARRQVLTDIEHELEKITKKYKRKCDNYILITNVPLSSVHATGNHDQIIDMIAPRFKSLIPHIQVWGGDEVHRFLDKYPNIRKTYNHLLISSDVIEEVLHSIKSETTIAGNNKNRAERAIIYIKRGKVRQEVEDYDGAIAEYTLAIEQDPNLTEAYSCRANAYYVRGKESDYYYSTDDGDYAHAIADYTHALQLKIALEIYLNRGAVYEALEEYDLAINDYLAAIKFAPTISYSYFRLGSIYSTAGYFDASIIMLSCAVQFDPKDAWTYNKRAKTYMAMGKQDEALADYKKVLELTDDPDLRQIARAAIDPVSSTTKPMTNRRRNDRPRIPRSRTIKRKSKDPTGIKIKRFLAWFLPGLAGRWKQ